MSLNHVSMSLKKCVFVSNQKCTTQPTLVNLHPNEYTEGLRYYPFAVNLDRCVRSCNTLNDLSNMCSKQYRRFKSSVFNMRSFNYYICIKLPIFITCVMHVQLSCYGCNYTNKLHKYNFFGDTFLIVA